MAIGRCACVPPRPGAFLIWITACWRRQRCDGRAGRNGPPLSVALTARPWHSSPSQHRPPSQSSNEVLYSGTSPPPIPILSKSSSRHWIRYGECPRFILRWNFGAHPWRSLVRVYALPVDYPGPMATNVQIPYGIRTMLKPCSHSDHTTPYELRKVKDIWFATRHNINNWLKNMFG